MDDDRFDLVTRTLGRRGIASVLLGLVWGVGMRRPVAAAVSAPPCSKKGPGGRCRGGGQCCSGRCKKKKAKRKGRCRCSTLRRPCRENADCCEHSQFDIDTPICESKDGFETLVCCMKSSGACATDADCCLLDGCFEGACKA